MGEREFAVGPLATPGAKAGGSPEQLSLYDSVRLFIDRAQQAKPDFQITAHNAPALADLCDRLEGIPLAIELAAARSVVITPTQMLALLGNRFELLVSRKRGIAARQRTLRATLDWSYQLLTPDLQRFFAGLSVFRGGWSVAAAEAVLEEPLALDYLAQLRDCSMVLVQEVQGEIRFGFLETLREYAAQQLIPEERAARQGRHLTFYLAHFGAQKYPGGWWHPVAQAQLEAEMGNFRAAIAWEPVVLDESLLLTDGICNLLHVKGHWTEARRWVELGLARSPEPVGQRVDLLTTTSKIAGSQGDNTAATAYAEEGLALAEAREDRRAVAAIVYSLSSLARRQNDYRAQRASLQRALSLYEAIEDVKLAGYMRIALGQNFKETGDFAQARALYEECLRHYLAADDEPQVASTLGYLGELARVQGDFQGAERYFTEAVERYQRLGGEHQQSLGHSLSGLARVRWSQKDDTGARVANEEALAVYRSIGDHLHVTSALTNLGWVACLQSDYPAARAYFTECLAARRKLGDPRLIADSLREVGYVARQQGTLDEARGLLQESLALYRQRKQLTGIARVLSDLALLEVIQGREPLARKHLAECLGVLQEQEHPPAGIARLLEVEGALAAENPVTCERAARLLGAAAGLRMRQKTPLPAEEVVEQERLREHLREVLGSSAYQALHEAAHSLSLEEALAFQDWRSVRVC